MVRVVRMSRLLPLAVAVALLGCPQQQKQKQDPTVIAEDPFSKGQYMSSSSVWPKP